MSQYKYFLVTLEPIKGFLHFVFVRLGLKTIRITEMVRYVINKKEKLWRKPKNKLKLSHYSINENRAHVLAYSKIRGVPQFELKKTIVI